MKMKSKWQLDWEENWILVDKNNQPEFLYCYNKQGVLEKHPGNILRCVNFIHKKTGEVMTGYGWMPDARLYGCPFFISEEALLNTLSYEI